MRDEAEGVGASVAVTLALTAEQLDVLADAVAERLAASQPAPELDGWLNTRQAAAYMACTADRLHDLVARRVLSPRRDGRRLLFKRSDIDAYLEASE